MIVWSENQKMYLRPLEYNFCKIMSLLAEIVEENGGRVKPLKTALISDRGLDNKEFVRVTHTSYISFVLDEMMYYFQIDDNPFFPFYYTKTAIKDGKYSYDACLDETPKDWFVDEIWRSNCSEETIRDAAQWIFEWLHNAPETQIIRDYKKVKVPNIYDDGYHTEKVMQPERIKTVDF